MKRNRLFTALATTALAAAVLVAPVVTTSGPDQSTGPAPVTAPAAGERPAPDDERPTGGMTCCFE